MRLRYAKVVGAGAAVARRLDERLKESRLLGPRDERLGVPLDADHELAVHRLERLHRPVGRATGDHQPAAEPRDARRTVRYAVLINDVRLPKLNENQQAILAELAGGAAAWAAACGSVPLPAFTVTKLRWLRRCEPEVLRRTAAVMLPHDWLTWRLASQHVTRAGGPLPHSTA